MSDIIYYESVDSKISITDKYIHAYRTTYKVEDLKSGQGLRVKPDQTMNLAIAFLGIICILLGKHRAGQLSQILDVNILFSATNYFDLTGLFLILITLLMTLPQTEQYSIRLVHNSGKQIDVILKEKKHSAEIADMDRAIKQAIRYAEYKKKIS